MTHLDDLRNTLRSSHLADEKSVLETLLSRSDQSPDLRQRTKNRAIKLVEGIRASGNPGLMEVFLAEYGLSTDEGVALMCLAEALLRVPDAKTMDDLIDDKITPSSWNEHLGKSSSSLVNASTWALMLTGKVLSERGNGIQATLRGAVKRLGEPVIRTAVHQAMREMGRQFVLGQTIEEAIDRGRKQTKKGYSYSYDMLGEAALTKNDAARNFDEYAASIAALAPHCVGGDIRTNPGISIKLSAIHPRYDYTQAKRVIDELVPRVLELATQAAAAGMGLNIDAEEADRLDLSLDVIQAVLQDPALAGWDGFGVVVQAYGKRAAPAIDWLYELAAQNDRRIMVRLVKGAYWDTEIKHAQVEAHGDFPVFTQKEATDVSYICCAQQLLLMTDRIYPQFATHNAHTVAAVLEIAGDRESFEFQRLHGMGNALHELVLDAETTKCRIYAPVGTHRDLLAYLVRRLLENGANSSFVNQIVSDEVSAEEICADPFEAVIAADASMSDAIKRPAHVFEPFRLNSRGYDIRSLNALDEIEMAREKYQKTTWSVGPLTVAPANGADRDRIQNPALPSDVVGDALLTSLEETQSAVANAKVWPAPAAERAAVLSKASDLFEENFGEIFAVLCREAGKTLDDAIAEIREAVDFMRFYAGEAERLAGADPRGVIACISPWNFPLAIFGGQIAAALAAGNAVLAKPAESTPIIAHIATRLMHEAGVPVSALQLLPGSGSVVGAAITSDPRVAGVCFTGSTATAQLINRSMAGSLSPSAPLIAETGGINAMIVDSTALPEQAIQDIVQSAFKSAGQRCSALRVLYLQEDIAEPFLEMLAGTMDELSVADPWALSTDIGPIIDEAARAGIVGAIETARSEGRLIKQLDAPENGTFVGPAVISVAGIGDVTQEIFGPVLHVATFHADELDKVVDDINAAGYGLTFGMHSRIDDRIAQVTSHVRAGNTYINRNQIGAIVASQPFGGEGLSGTGPKAGGPSYVERFTASKTLHPTSKSGAATDPTQVQQAINDAAANWQQVQLSSRAMAGPTGESNMLSTFGRGVILCLGTGPEEAKIQADVVRQNGCIPVIVAPGATSAESINGFVPRAMITDLANFQGVVLWSDEADQSLVRQALAARPGPILPLMTERHFGDRCRLERHICIDTTAAGGNAALLASTS